MISSGAVRSRTTANAMRRVLVALCVAALIGVASADEYDHKYLVGDAVTLWVNKVGPFNNPQETYNYHELPFCKVEGVDGKRPKHKWGGLGEILEGNELIDSNMEFRFRHDQPKKTMCITSLDANDVKKFKRSIRHHYWYEFVMDDLPIWGFVGEHVDEKSTLTGSKSATTTAEAADLMADDVVEHRGGTVYIYTHKTFDISYKGDRIIGVNLTAENPKPLVPGTDLEFTYSVNWKPTETKFGKRFERYLDYNFFEHQIHWFSIFNSFMMVIFLTGLVSMILMRTLRKDYAKYSRDDDDIEAMDQGASMEESGWKLVHGDVFRAPRYLPALSALIGTGVQMALLILLVILITIFGMLYEGRGTIITVFITCYALTSFVGGYVSGGYNARNEGKSWIKAMLLTAGLFPGLCFGIAFALNTVAIFYHSLAAVPFGTMVVIFVMWSCISFPLVLFGTVIGRNWNGAPDNPCRVKAIPRPIPEAPWFLTPKWISVAGGLPPFGSIFIETYFVFTSIWSYKVYYVYGFFLLVFCILVIVTLCITIVGTYFLLNAENHKWQWTAFNSAASVAGYVYLYSIYYFAFKTKMTGFFQTCFYFGYTAMFCLALGITTGAIGYCGASAFVRKIYRNIKVD